MGDSAVSAVEGGKFNEVLSALGGETASSPENLQEKLNLLSKGR